MSKMLEPRIAKVTINMGVGEAGEKIAKAETVLTQLTGKKPVRTISKATVPVFGVRKGQELGCKVTLRGKDAEEVLRRALSAVEHKIPRRNFDKFGNFSFGVKEHIEVQGMRYDPKIGIFGMDVCVSIERPGYRVERRKIASSKMASSHRLTPEGSIKFLETKMGVTVVG